MGLAVAPVGRLVVTIELLKPLNVAIEESGNECRLKENSKTSAPVESGLPVIIFEEELLVRHLYLPLASERRLYENRFDGIVAPFPKEPQTAHERSRHELKRRRH